jgi:starch phosphorylase
VLDGWWVEGYLGDKENHNGWSIGEERAYKDEETQDQADVLHLYATLENEIIPLYFDRNEAGVPEKWLTIMKNSIRTCTPQFSMQRMVKEYTTTFYLPAMQSGAQYHNDHFATARAMSAWKNHMRQSWGSVRIEPVAPDLMQIQAGQAIELSARVWLNRATQDEVALEIVAGELNEQGELTTPTVAPMTAVSTQDGALIYQGQLQPTDSGQLVVGIRARPQNEHLINRHETGLNRWA